MDLIQVTRDDGSTESFAQMQRCWRVQERRSFISPSLCHLWGRKADVPLTLFFLTCIFLDAWHYSVLWNYQIKEILWLQRAFEGIQDSISQPFSFGNQWGDDPTKIMFCSQIHLKTPHPNPLPALVSIFKDEYRQFKEFCIVQRLPNGWGLRNLPPYSSRHPAWTPQVLRAAVGGSADLSSLFHKVRKRRVAGPSDFPGQDLGSLLRTWRVLVQVLSNGN